MAVDAVRYRSRKGDRNRGAKERRQKIFLGAAAVVLVALLAFEGPKTLKKLHGSSIATPAPAPATIAAPAASPAASTPATEQAKASLATVKHMAAKDPFAVQIGVPAGSAPAVQAPTAPTVRESHFVAKDPFVQQVTASSVAVAPAAGGGSSPTKPGGSATTPKADATGKYIVVLASIPLSSGHGVASQAAAAARSHGVGSVSIVDSSKYPTLRTGFFAVYSGPYPTLKELQPALESIRGQGYPSAYTRQLAH
jgi:hypothetical protein